jgi:hypothetical protein
MALGLMLVGVIAFVAALAVGFAAGLTAGEMIWRALVASWAAMAFAVALRLLDEGLDRRRGARQRLSDAERGGEPGAGGHER